MQVHELPPAYTINLSSHDDGSNRGGENRTERVGGIINQSFTCDENQQQQEQQQSHRQGQTTDGNENTRSEDDIRNNSITNRTCDSVLYI